MLLLESSQLRGGNSQARVTLIIFQEETTVSCLHLTQQHASDSSSVCYFCINALVLMVPRFQLLHEKSPYEHLPLVEVTISEVDISRKVRVHEFSEIAEATEVHCSGDGKLMCCNFSGIKFSS